MIKQLFILLFKLYYQISKCMLTEGIKELAEEQGRVGHSADPLSWLFSGGQGTKGAQRKGLEMRRGARY